jgi:Insertion element 4 transposase N-terminal
VLGVVPVAEGVPELSGLGVLTWVYPPDLVDRVVAACDRAEQRRRLPAKSSLSRARKRLGAEPLRVLSAATARPLATPSTPGAFWQGLRLMAVDGSCWDAADTPANDKEFGRPGTHRVEGGRAFPQIRMVALVEWHPRGGRCRAGRVRVSEVTLAARVASSAGPGMLMLADREFLGVPLWRVPANRVLDVE